MLGRTLVLAAAAVSVALAAGCAAPADGGADTGSSAADVTSTNVPANFVKVRDGLYRGGHPDAGGMAYLKSLGVKRIVNLEVGDFVEAFPWDIDHELSDAEKAGITELRYPMSAFEAAVSDRFDRQMDEIEALLATATPDDPIYVHCKHGQDRTGLVIGLERVLDEHWDPQAAFDEMVRIGFHTGFIGLDEYFERKTGFHEQKP